MIDFLLPVLKYFKTFYLWFAYLFGLWVFFWFGLGFFFCENGNCGHTTRRKRASIKTYVIFAYMHRLYSSCSSTEK